MITTISTVEELSNIWLEIFLGKTDKVTKVADGGVLKGTATSNGKIGQRIMKDLAVIESELLPDTAFDIYLDNVARLRGISTRFGLSTSSTYIRVVGNPGTKYFASTQIFSGNGNITFVPVADFVIGPIGYGYVKVNSVQSGSNANIKPLTINTVTPIPTGHKYCVNEYGAFGGFDNESDQLFQARVKTGPNILAKGNIALLEQVFQKINNNVLRVIYGGIDANSNVVLNIMSVNGIDFDPSEFTDILNKGQKYFSLTELKPDGFDGYGVVLQNVNWQVQDISYRCDLFPGVDIDQVRIACQIAMNKYFDYRFWKVGQVIAWTDLIAIVKSIPGVRYVYDNYFYPNFDVIVDMNAFPRIRGFQMLDKNGNLLSGTTGTLNPFYFPFPVDFLYQAAVLQSI